MPTRRRKGIAKESTNISNPYIEEYLFPVKYEKKDGVTVNTYTEPKTDLRATLAGMRTPQRDSALAENWRAHDRMQQSTERYNEARYKEANKYMIPYIPEKEIRLTTGRYNTGRISTNILDSIYDAAKRTGVPVDIALGLAGRESTFGIGRGFKRGHSITGTDLMSNWQQIQPFIMPENLRKEYNNVVAKYNNGTPLTAEEADVMIGYWDTNDKAVNSTRPLTENPIDNALKFYMTGGYNPGDDRHTKMVEEDARIVMSDPAIQKWYQSRVANEKQFGGRTKFEKGGNKNKNVSARDNTSVPQVIVDEIVPMTERKLDEISRVLTYDKNGNPIRIARQNEALDLVSPEFDLLTLARGITNLPKGFLKTNKLPQGENLYYRQLNKNSKGLERAKQVGVIDTQSSGGRTFTTSNGKTFSIGKTFDTPFFAKGNLWYNNVDDMDVIVGKDNPVLDWKMITQHGRVTNNAAKAANRRTPFYNGDTNQAPTELFELYRRYPFIGYRNVTNGFPTVPITGLNTISENIDMKRCGGRRKAQLGLDIREGGIAIPIAKNMYYMQGRSHEAGGIGIGPNNKNGLEVEGGEVVKVGKDNVRVFSSVPFLRGASPAQLVMGGANPDTVFKAQENFKDRNRINDDGTKYETGGDKKTDSAIRTEDDKKVSRYKRAVYSLVDPTMPYPDNTQAVGYVLGAGLKTLTDPDGMLYTVNDSVSDAAWRKRLGLSYDDKFLVPNKDGSVRLPKSREKEIPVDTTMLKKRIAANTKLAERYPKHLQNGSLNEKRKIVDWALRVDQEALDGLRHTYKTGEPVTINEGAYNSRQLIRDGELRWPEIMPHNVLQNYTIQYNPQTKQMEYKDVYDFNEFEWGVPGKPFDIKGSVPTKRYGGNDKSVHGSIKTKTQTTNDSKNGNTFRQISRNVMKNGLPFYQILESNDKGEMKKVFIQNPDSTYYSEQSGIRYKDNNPLNVHTFNYNTIPEDLRNYINILDNNNSSVKRYGGNMLYTINGNVKNGLMSLRRKARFGDEEKDKEFDLGELAQVEVVAEKPKDKPKNEGSGTTPPVEERWVGQYRPTTVGDWIGLGGNLIGSLASYIGTRNMINDIPMPQKPVAAPIMKLKTRFNINAPLTEINEQEQMQRDMISRNTSSSNVSLARQQRVMNEAQRSRNQLYTQKENIETQLTNQDRLNRQTMMSKNVDAYNQWLNNFIQSKSSKASLKATNFNNLISGLTGGIGDMLSRIESRRTTNNTIQAMAAANPNVDARQIGNFDYYNVYDKKTGKFIRKTKRIE